MKESESLSNLKIKLHHIVIAIVFIGCVSAITSFITVKTLTSTLPNAISTPSFTPTQTLLQTPAIESNLLQNSGFENGLSGWKYTDNQEGVTVFETTGVTGKAYCSRRLLYGHQPELLDKDLIGFVQEIPLDPTFPYVFSAWVKLYNATDAIAQGKTYYESKPTTTWNLNLNLLPQHENTTDGWVYIERYLDAGVPSGGLPTWTSILIGFWHRPIQKGSTEFVDSTFCIDDVVFRKTVK